MNTKKQPTKKTVTAFVAEWLKTYTFDSNPDRLSVLDLAIDACIEAIAIRFECNVNEKTIELISSLIDASLAVEPVNFKIPVAKPVMSAKQALQLLLVPSVDREVKAAEIVQQPAVIDTVIELQTEVHLHNGVTLKVNPNVNTNLRTGLPVKYNIVPPKRAGKCYDVWVKCNELLSQGITPTSNLIDTWSIDNGYNVQNGRIELYRFMKYYGIAKTA